MFLTTIRVRSLRRNTISALDLADVVRPAVEVMAHGQVVAVVDTLDEQTDGRVRWTHASLSWSEDDVNALVNPPLALMKDVQDAGLLITQHATVDA